ncbi:spore coat CotO family protein [Bacillus sp. FJAT-29790]|uniref:CotO family spore coat protein n=1 Tax=Bacillus sp. FJAT-29790 TaxID=1895002 RepID=UPI001C231C2A|nr:CotO family spore coat protein [Bacillus sp. FJAT-29790]MBU8877487.1 spore coat CotO family protein [Bacillus sp. FJAT-29790]
MTGIKKKNPNVFINQPAMIFPNAKMQEFYSSKKNDMEKEKQPIFPIEKSKIDEESRLANLDFFETKVNLSSKEQKKVSIALKAKDPELELREKVQEVIEAYESQQVEKEQTSTFAFRSKSKLVSSFQRIKSFNEMNTVERLDYLIHFPKQLPPIPCIFETEGNTLIGFLISKKEEIIEVKLFDGKTEEMKIQALKEVRMVGIRKKG